MLRILLFTFCLLSFQEAAAQIYKVGDILSDAQLKELKNLQIRRNAKYLGMPLPAITAHTSTGSLLNNASMKGDIYLLALWRPDCNCFDPSKLHPLVELAPKQKDFHFISVIPDTVGLANCMKCKLEPIDWAVTSTYTEAKSLALGNGHTSYVLVNRAGIVVRIISAVEKYEYTTETYAEFAKAIEALLKI
jgi:hypothetical protein